MREMKGGPESSPVVHVGLFLRRVHMQAAPLFHNSGFHESHITEEYGASSHCLWCPCNISSNCRHLRCSRASMFLLWTFLQKTASRNFRLYLSPNRILEDPLIRISSPILSLGNVIWEESFICLEYHDLPNSCRYQFWWCDLHTIFRTLGSGSPVFVLWLFISCIIWGKSHTVHSFNV